MLRMHGNTPCLQSTTRTEVWEYRKVNKADHYDDIHNILEVATINNKMVRL